MSVDKFKFVSPGVFIDEIDNSQVPRTAEAIGPLVIGRTERGPAMRPVKVQSFSEFVEIFGNPIPGGDGGDVWRDGNKTSATYAPYAAQAWLKNSGPINVVRVLGNQHTDANTAGSAGWKTTNTPAHSINAAGGGASGGAYGLVLFGSASAGTDTINGTLAAVWYINDGSMHLSGTVGMISGSWNQQGAGLLVKSQGANHEFKAVRHNSSGENVETINFNFSPTSNKYIRKVFNTNPTLTNTSVTNTAQQEDYFLGETYERSIVEHVEGNHPNASNSGASYGVIVALGLQAATHAGIHQQGMKAAQTGWFFSQDLRPTAGGAPTGGFDISTHTQQLFRLVALDGGAWTSQNLKVSIKDIKASTNLDNPYGKFTVVVRRMADNDNREQIIEQFSSCNLNPNSPDYIAKKIGDKYVTWDDYEKRHKEYGNYANQSKHLRVEMNADVHAGATNAEYLPFGVYGPVRPKTITFCTGSGGLAITDGLKANAGASTGTAVTVANSFLLPMSSYNTTSSATAAGTWTSQVTSFEAAKRTYTSFFLGAMQPVTGTIRFPSVPLRANTQTPPVSNPKHAYFGADTTKSGSVKLDKSNLDTLRPLPSPMSAQQFSPGASTEYSWQFTLDDLTSYTAGGGAKWTSGSRDAGTSITALSASYKEILDQGFNRFTTVLDGGYDGWDVSERDPINNTRMGDNELNEYAYYSVKRAIDACSDPEVVDFNLAAAPGIYKPQITEHLINTCEGRGDALAVIDIENDFKTNAENTSGDQTNVGTVDSAVASMLSRGLNSSYGCAFYPWVQARDTISNRTLWMPPSVAALGTMASSERKSELWFAPAGFTRGGLTDGAAGIPIVGVRQRLTSEDRDKLYEADINPIATFPSEGIVIFGQKTLQATDSALDRINVRRLMIHVKKEISRMASTLLFDQNVRTTWNRFRGQAEPFLMSIKTRLGLTDFRVVLDESTTTPDLVDRNIMYAKILLKPAKAIEFIALDFVITNDGAAFED